MRYEYLGISELDNNRENCLFLIQENGMLTTCLLQETTCPVFVSEMREFFRYRRSCEVIVLREYITEYKYYQL